MKVLQLTLKNSKKPKQINKQKKNLKPPPPDFLLCDSCLK